MIPGTTLATPGDARPATGRIARYDAGMLRRALTAAVAILAIAGCQRGRGGATTPAVPATTESQRRDAPPPPLLSALPPRLPLPAEVVQPSPVVPGERLPLLIFLHGLGGSGTQLFRFLDLERFGRQQRVIVIAPDGTRDRSGRPFWNAGPACCNIDGVAVDDVARLGALIDQWRARPDVDPRRVYVAGFSNGGFMAHRLACAIGERLAAVASISGAGPEPDEDCPGAATAIGVLEVHGDNDGVVSDRGGRVFDEPTLSPYPSARAAMAGWARRMGCRAHPDETATALHGTARFRGCARGGVELWTIHGGDHRLPSGAMIEEIGVFGALDQADALSFSSRPWREPRLVHR